MTSEHQDTEALQFAVLVQKTRKGDAAAFGSLIDLTRRRLFKFAVMLTHNSTLAEDLCQETYLKAFESIAKLNKPDRVMSWLYQILRNLSIDQFKKKSNQLERSSEDASQIFEPSTAGPDREQLLYVRQLMQGLDPDDRFLVLSVHLEGYSYREVGEMMGLTEDAVRLRLHRVGKALIEKMKKD